MNHRLRPLLPVALALGSALVSTGCRSVGSAAPDSTEPHARAVAALAQAAEDGPGERSGRLAVPVGLGFTADPSTFLLSGAVDIPVAERITVGPSVHAGFADDRNLIGVTAQAKYHFPLEGDREIAQRLTPFVQGGIGFAYIDKDRPVNDDEIGLLLDVGGGARYRVEENLSLGSQMMFHVMPDSVVGENFYFSWEVVQLVVEF